MFGGGPVWTTSVVWVRQPANRPLTLEPPLFAVPMVMFGSLKACTAELAVLYALSEAILIRIDRLRPRLALGWPDGLPRNASPSWKTRVQTSARSLRAHCS